MELKDYLAALRRFWTAWVGATVLGVLLAVLVLQLSTPTYDARAQVFVASSSTGTSQMVSQRVKSYPDVAVSRAVLDPVIERLNLKAGFIAVKGNVRASNPVDTSQIVIVATSTDPQQAADLANAVAEEFTGVVENLESPASGISPVNLTVTDPAVAPSSPASPNRLYVLSLGLVVGLLLGLALAIVRSRASTAVYDEPALRAAWGEEDALQVLTPPPGRAARRARAGRPAAAMARRLELMAEDHPVRVLLVSPASAPSARGVAGEFAAEVVAELTARGVSAQAAEYDPARTAREINSDIRVRIDTGDAQAPLSVWRRVAEGFAGVALVVPAGRLVAAELHEMREILDTAGIHPLAVVLTDRSRATRAAIPTPERTKPHVPARPAQRPAPAAPPAIKAADQAPLRSRAG
jgi:capsular polysaccharide biosynthesis protein